MNAVVNWTAFILLIVVYYLIDRRKVCRVACSIDLTWERVVSNYDLSVRCKHEVRSLVGKVAQLF